MSEASKTAGRQLTVKGYRTLTAGDVERNEPP